jgi:hypothetical protein
VPEEVDTQIYLFAKVAVLECGCGLLNALAHGFAYGSPGMVSHKELQAILQLPLMAVP